jgi:hypothetical protein
VERIRLTGRGGSPILNPKALGFSWRAAQKLVEEESRLWQQLREAGREEQAQDAEIRRIKEAHALRRAVALRAGDGAPDEADVVRAERKLEEIKERQADLRRALELAYMDRISTVGKNREKWIAELEERAAEKRAHREELAAQLADLDQEIGALEGLEAWLFEPEKGFAA